MLVHLPNLKSEAAGSIIYMKCGYVMRIQGILVEIFVGWEIFFLLEIICPCCSEWSLLAKVITIWVLSVKSCLVLKKNWFLFCFTVLNTVLIIINIVFLPVNDYGYGESKYEYTQ
jgi:hypothetical protein